MNALRVFLRRFILNVPRCLRYVLFWCIVLWLCRICCAFWFLILLIFARQGIDNQKAHNVYYV